MQVSIILSRVTQLRDDQAGARPGTHIQVPRDLESGVVITIFYRTLHQLSLSYVQNALGIETARQATATGRPACVQVRITSL